MTKRIKWLDFAKGITILFVVLLHTIQFSTKSYDRNIINIITYILGIFVMPVFFAISGFLYKSTKTFKLYKVLLYKKISSLLIPYILFTIIFEFISNIHSLKIIYLIHKLYSVFNKQLWISLIIPTSYLWFLYALFIIFVFIGLIDLFDVSFQFKIFIISILLVISVLLPYPHFFSNIIERNQTNPIMFTLGYLSCFYIGYLIKESNVTKYLKAFNTLYLFLLWLILVIIQYYIRNDINTDSFNCYDLFTKLLSIFVFFSIFMSFRHNRIFNYFTKYGKYTLIIYLVHIPILFIIPNIFINMLKLNIFKNYFLPDFILNMAISWGVSILICYLSNKYNIINFVFYPRKYISALLSRNYKKDC